jgi:hypothetical protein
LAASAATAAAGAHGRHRLAHGGSLGERDPLSNDASEFTVFGEGCV